jgi:hypothetical protein
VDVLIYINVPGSTPILLATVTTAADGSWILTGISGVDLQDNMIVTYDPATVPTYLVSTQSTNLPLGEDTYSTVDLLSDPDNNISYLDFAFAPVANLGSVSGTIYSDSDQDASYVPLTDGELEGVTVNLLDSSGNVIATTTTDVEGNYAFTQLPDGNYTIEVTDLGNVLGDLNPLETIEPIVILGANDVTDQNAGYISDADLGSIGNRFWFDINRDGFMQDDEPGIAGITVQCWLDADNSETPNDPLSVTNPPVPGVDNLIRTVVTDENGEYYCTSLPSAQYIVVVADSLDFTEAGDGTLVTGTVGDHAAKPWIYALTTDSPNLTADFGVAGNNELSGSIFIEDEDLVESADAILDIGGGAGGVEDGGETDGVGDGVNDSPAEGVTVVLYIQQPDGTFSQLQTTTTDANGDYSFTGLPDGVYQVEVLTSGSPVDGFGQTADPDLTGNAFPNNVCDSPTAVACDDSTEVTLAGGAQTGIDFGYQKDFVTTPVTVHSFVAKRVGSGVEFTWESSNEVGHVGFQLYARTADGWTLLNDELIVSTDQGNALATRRYTFNAEGVDAKWFTIIDVSAAEELTPHGPFQINQVYGGELVRPIEFDWSGISRTENTTRETEESVSSRVERMRNLILDEDDGDEPHDGEDDFGGEE